MRIYKKRIKISITKYDPEISEYGRFDEWTSISDVGKVYENRIFKYEDYLKIEDLYVRSVFLILDFFKKKKIKIQHIFKFEKKSGFSKYNNAELYSTYSLVKENDVIGDDKMIDQLVRLRLREKIAELEISIDKSSRTEVLFGFDYYMYLKTNVEVDDLINKIKEIGLFIDY